MNRTRRKILLALAGASAPRSLASFTYGKSLTAVEKIAPEVQSTLQLCCPNLSDARRLGQIYLKQKPQEATVAILESNLWSDNEDSESEMDAPDLAVSRVRQVLQRHLQDCAETHMITVNGIMLTRTEARMYALGYLLT